MYFIDCIAHYLTIINLKYYTPTANGHTASIEFQQTTDDLSDLKASYIMTTNPTVLPDPRNHYANRSTSSGHALSLQPYAALQLTVKNGVNDTVVTMVTGGFAMVIPLEYDLANNNSGKSIPAWYFHEVKGKYVWKIRKIFLLPVKKH